MQDNVCILPALLYSYFSRIAVLKSMGKKKNCIRIFVSIINRASLDCLVLPRDLIQTLGNKDQAESQADVVFSLRSLFKSQESKNEKLGLTRR